MRQFFNIAFALFFSFNGVLFAQVNPGLNCATAGCSVSGSYTNITGTASMGTYDCLFSTPNPNWLAFSIQNTGAVHLQLTQTSNGGSMIDVDFALYGPFTSLSAGCPTINGSTPTVDCSYSASATEYVDINNAIAGQVYILLVTNYNGSAGTISLQQSPNQPSAGGLGCAVNFSGTTSQVPAFCNQPNGSVSVTPVGGYAPYTYSWNIPGNPTTSTVNNVPPGTYTVTITSSNGPNGQPVNPTTATVTVQNINATYSSTSTPASCPGGLDGTATANFNCPGSPTATYLWNDPAAQTTKIATGLLPGSYTCTVTLSNGCTGTTTVTVGANTVTYTGTSTLVSCPGGSDGSATVVMAPAIGTLSYLWDDPNAQTSQTATNLAAGTYSCTITSTLGCTGTVNIAVTEIPGMIANFIAKTDVTCYTKNDGMLQIDVTQGTAPYTYSWDHSASTAAIANDLFVGQQTVSVTDALGCVVTATENLTEPDPLRIIVMAPDSIICPEDSITISAQGMGGSTTYTYTWSENGVVIGTGASITVDPLNSGTQYCVELSEACGSPTTDSCMTITFPPAIVPNYISNLPYSCLPGEFIFFNQSTNINLIDSVIVDFGNGNTGVFQDNGDITYTYTHHGVYTLTVTAISNRGCVTQNTFLGIANVLPNPTANFNMANNPTTIFETNVTMVDASSSDVSTWEWYAPGATNANHSTVRNPLFHYPEGVIDQYEVRLIVTTPEGCIDTITKILSVINDIILYAPNTFTPDGDEFNQSWRIHISGIDQMEFDLQVFDRWGEVVWQSHDANASWDGTYNGTICKEGTYVWIARVKDMYSDGKKTYKGTINLIR
jgi:gliding motility-associated-like protein